MKRITLVLLLLVLAFTVTTFASQEFSDVSESDWFYSDVKSAVEMGLINGKANNTYCPNDNLTYAEAVKLAACMNEKYLTGKITLENGDPWYKTYFNYCKKNGIVSGELKSYPFNEKITRAEYMEIFAKTLPAEALNTVNYIPLNSIADVPATEDYAPEVYKLYRAGIVAGSDLEHNCKPDSNIKRSEVAAILVRMMDETKRVKFSTAPETVGTNYTVGIIADVHNGAGKFNTALTNIIDHAGGIEELDGVALVGDIIYTPETSTPNYDFLTNSSPFNKIKDADKLMYVMGNHEYPLNATMAKAPEKVELAKELFTEKTGEPLEEDTVIGGYHFITVSSHDYSNKLNSDQEKYITEHIKAALAEDDTKPVFLFLHQTVDGTLNGSLKSNLQSTEFEEFVKKEPRLIVISGHTHYTLSDPHSIYQVPGGATFLYTSVVSTSVGQSMAYANVSHREYSSQGIMLSVNDETNVVTLKRFYVDPENPAFLEGGDWTFDIPAMIEESRKPEPSLDVYKYTNARAELSAAPSFNKDCKISVSDISDTSIEFNFPNATPASEDDNNYVGYYKIEILNGVSGEVLKCDKIISDFFILKKSDTNYYSFYNLPYAEKWVLKITPVSTWYVEGEPLTLEITPPKPEFEYVPLDESATFEADARDLKVVSSKGHYSIKDEYITVYASGTATIRYNYEIEKSGTYRLIINAAAEKGVEVTVSVTKRTDAGDTVIYEAKRKIGTSSVSTPMDFTACDFEAESGATYVVKIKKNKADADLRVYTMTIGKHN